MRKEYTKDFKKNQRVKVLTRLSYWGQSVVCGCWLVV